LTNPDENCDFELTGPAPLQTTAPVACGDAGCLYNHLNWSSGSEPRASQCIDGSLRAHPRRG
jgi:hypothetical protein